MVLTGLIAGTVTAAIMLGGFLLIYMVLKRRIIRGVTAFISQPDEKTPSPLANFVDQGAAVFAARLVLQTKTTLMGMASVDSKNETREAAAAALKGAPGLAALLNFIPGGKRLLRRPDLLSIGVQLLGTIGKQGNGSKPAEPSHQDTMFKL
jgi:hypothetical protein